MIINENMNALNIEQLCMVPYESLHDMQWTSNFIFEQKNDLKQNLKLMNIFLY